MNHQMVALHHGDFHKLLVDVEVELHLMEEFVGGDFYQIKLKYQVSAS